MTRSPSPLVLGLTLALGVTLGLLAARPSPSASAQQAAPGAATRRAVGGEGDEPADRELARQYEAFRGVDRVFELAARSVAPAVVHIVATKPGEREDGTPAQVEESGSGVIVRPDKGGGLCVLTNNHVVAGAVAADVSILLHDGRVIRPSTLWSDPKADVAVLKLGRDDLPAARLGDSDEIRVGHWVLAIGSPFGLKHSVSHGIISARGRHEQELEDDGVENQDFLQTDAAINPGNSGGPLVSLRGEVIGINTAIASNGGGSEGVGFSIPINLARWIMAQLVSTGRVSRGAMGVNLQELTQQRAQELGLDRPRGARIDAVQAASPASVAGLRPNDVVLRYNGSEVANFNHLINLISMTPIGESADLVVWREKRSLSARVSIADRDEVLAMARAARPDAVAPPVRGQRPDAPAEPATASVLGLELRTLDGPAARSLNLPEALRGVVVTKVDPSSPLAATLRPVDVITAVAGRSVEGASDAARAIRRRGAQTPLDLIIERSVGGVLQRYSVQVP